MTGTDVTTDEFVRAAEAVWAEYQRTHDVSAREGEAVGVDPHAGEVFFGRFASDIWRQLDAEGRPRQILFVTRVGRPSAKQRAIVAALWQANSVRHPGRATGLRAVPAGAAAVIAGRLDRDGRAVVAVAVAGRPFDTGFDGGISLPDVLAPILNLPVRTRNVYQLGDGSQIEVPVYESDVELGGERFTTEVIYSASDEVLLGTAVLRYFRLEIDYPAGTVRLDRPGGP